MIHVDLVDVDAKALDVDGRAVEPREPFASLEFAEAPVVGDRLQIHEGGRAGRPDYDVLDRRWEVQLYSRSAQRVLTLSVREVPAPIEIGERDQ